MKDHQASLNTIRPLSCTIKSPIILYFACIVLAVLHQLTFVRETSGLCRYFAQDRMVTLHEVWMSAVFVWITVYCSCPGAPPVHSSVCQDGPTEPGHWLGVISGRWNPETQRQSAQLQLCWQSLWMIELADTTTPLHFVHLSATYSGCRPGCYYLGEP